MSLTEEKGMDHVDIVRSFSSSSWRRVGILRSKFGRTKVSVACGGRFTTYERVQLRDLVVIKSNGRREDFDRDKLERSIRIALQKRPVEHERMEQMISGIVRRLESLGETDINSNKIGEIVMEALARIDTVAYVRFASVYKNFQAADDFDKFVSELRPPDTEDKA